MKTFSIQIAEMLNLEQLPVAADYFLVLGIFLLVIFTMTNLFFLSDETNKIELEEEIEIPKVVQSEVSTTEVVQEEVSKEEVISWEKRLFDGLGRTRSQVWGRISSIVGKSALNDETIEELEEILYTSDMSPALVADLLEDLKKNAGKEDINHLERIKEFLKSKMLSSQDKVNTELYDFKEGFKGPKVIMIVGVNGAGKTTTIGKLATKLKAQGANVVVGACDTFRAAAVEQLEVWCKRAGVEIVKSAEGSDPSGVAFDAVARAKEIGADYCIIDTAGRLHTKSNLMDELAKTKKVMSKVIPDAPHETLLVLDAITGQNALRQAEEFNKSLELSGLIFTKCDGSSKAGSAVSIVETLNVPIVYIGVGEGVEDLNIFNLNMFLDALLGLEAKA